MSETAKQRREREEREAAEAAAQQNTEEAPAEDEAPRQDATATPDVVEAKATAHEPGAEPPEDADQQQADQAQGGSVQRDAPPGTDATMAAPANQNAASFTRTEELFAAEQQLRGGAPVQPVYPKAIPREEQEQNAAELAQVQAANMTGTDDGVSSVYPQVAGPTNMALTPAEVFANLDDGAVDERGRLVGTYADDLEREEADRRRERIEQASSTPVSRAAAQRVRELASSSVTPAADLGRHPSEQGLVDGRKHTGHGDPNDQIRRAREIAAAENEKPAGARR